MEENEVVESTTEVVEDTTKNEIVEKGGENKLALQEISVDLFGESRTKRITSLNVEDPEDADMILNASQQADFKLNDEINQEITVIGCILSETPSETINEETGEVITRKKHTVLLIDKDGNSHATGSNSCYMSFAQIIKLKGMPTKENPLTLIPIKTPAKTEGHTYLRLKVKTNK